MHPHARPVFTPRDTHHLDQRRGQRGLRHEAIHLAAALGTEDAEGRYRLTERDRAAHAAELRAHLQSTTSTRLWLFQELRALGPGADRDAASGRDRCALKETLALADARIAGVRAELAALERARGVTVCCADGAALTAWRSL